MTSRAAIEINGRLFVGARETVRAIRGLALELDNTTFRRILARAIAAGTIKAI